MSTLSFTAAERLDGPAFRSGDDDGPQAAPRPTGLALAGQSFFALTGMPLVPPASALDHGGGA